MSGPTLNCPLCGSHAEFFLSVDDKNYFCCSLCALRFVDPAARPARATEHAHYMHHENEVDDPRYRTFLSRLAQPLMRVLKANSKGLDYGCGPGPALAAMLSEAGHEMAIYDPFFAPRADVLNVRYDFVSCTEVAEHFHDPAAEFQRLDELLKPGAVLGMITCFQTQDERFATWHYRKDPTHVVFYREETFRWIASNFGWELEIPRKDVALLFKSGTSR